MNPTETPLKQFDTEAIDRLFLELSQFTQAKTNREIELENALKADGRKDRPSDAAWGSTKNRVEHLEKVIATLKEERDDNYKEIVELKEVREQQAKWGAELKAQRDKMTAEVEANRKIRDALRKERDAACALVADMHRAAMGKTCGPIIGVDKDIEALRMERDSLKVEYLSRAEWIRKMVEILGCSNLDGRNCQDAHVVAQEMVNDLKILRANNRYHRGHSDGFREAMEKAAETLKNMRP